MLISKNGKSEKHPSQSTDFTLMSRHTTAQSITIQNLTGFRFYQSFQGEINNKHSNANMQRMKHGIFGK